MTAARTVSVDGSGEGQNAMTEQQEEGKELESASKQFPRAGCILGKKTDYCLSKIKQVKWELLGFNKKVWV